MVKAIGYIQQRVNAKSKFTNMRLQINRNHYILVPRLKIFMKQKFAVVWCWSQQTHLLADPFYTFISWSIGIVALYDVIQNVHLLVFYYSFKGI